MTIRSQIWRSIFALSVVASFCTLSMSAQMIGHWSFDNDSLDSRGGHHGQLHGAGYTTQSAVGSHAVQFGDRSQNRCVALGDFDPSDDDLSISLWINPGPAGSGHQILMAKRQAWAQDKLRWQFLWQDIHPPRKPIPGEPYTLTKEVLRFESWPDNRAEFPCKLKPGAWTHLALVYSAKEGLTRCFINGKETGEEPQTMRLGKPLDAPVVIGGGHPGDWREVFNGVIDDVAIWSQALTPAQVKAIRACAIHPMLNYDAGKVQALFELCQAAQADKAIVINGTKWRFSKLAGSTPGQLKVQGSQLTLALNDQEEGVVGTR